MFQIWSRHIHYTWLSYKNIFATYFLYFFRKTNGQTKCFQNISWDDKKCLLYFLAKTGVTKIFQYNISRDMFFIKLAVLAGPYLGGTQGTGSGPRITRDLPGHGLPTTRTPPPPTARQKWNVYIFVENFALPQPGEEGPSIFPSKAASKIFLSAFCPATLHQNGGVLNTALSNKT